MSATQTQHKDAWRKARLAPLAADRGLTRKRDKLSPAAPTAVGSKHARRPSHGSDYGAPPFKQEEAPGIGVFYKNDAGDVFHTYSTYGDEDGLAFSKPGKMGGCCNGRTSPRLARRLSATAASILPGALLLLLPKCPLCLAAWLTVMTGIGFSAASAAWLRGMVVLFSVAAMAIAAAAIARRRALGRAAALSDLARPRKAAPLRPALRLTPHP